MLRSDLVPGCVVTITASIAFNLILATCRLHVCVCVKGEIAVVHGSVCDDLRSSARAVLSLLIFGLSVTLRSAPLLLESSPSSASIMLFVPMVRNLT